MKNIAVTGSLAFDHIMDFPGTYEENILPHKIKTLSVSFLLKTFKKNFGGVAGNIAYSLSLLDQKPIILSCAGAEEFDSYKKHLEKKGVITTYIGEIKDAFTANGFLMTDRNNCQIAGFYPGAMEFDKDLSLNTVLAKQPIDLVVISPTVTEAMDTFVREAKEHSIPYVYIPAQQLPRISEVELRNGIDGAYILVANDYEMSLIEKKTGFTAKEIKQKAQIVITTLGGQGSVIEKDREKFEVGVAPIGELVDPTGAGDAYIAGFLAGLADGKDMKVCGQMGALIASYAVEHYGTQKHNFTKAEFEKRYQDSFDEKL
jgi:adenosine kinase